MTNSELIAELSKYPPDAEALTVWGTGTHKIKSENIYMSDWGELIIDADNNTWKFEFVKQSTQDGALPSVNIKTSLTFGEPEPLKNHLKITPIGEGIEPVTATYPTLTGDVVTYEWPPNVNWFSMPPSPPEPNSAA